MLYRRKFELDIEEVRPDLDILHQAAKELRTSILFKQVLQAVLSVGNALNGSTFRGGARGFQLEALLKVNAGWCFACVILTLFLDEGDEDRKG